MKKIFVLLAFGLLFNHLDAQSVNYSGKWILNKEKTGMDPFPDIILVIEQINSEIEYSTIYPDPSGKETIIKRIMPLNGQEVLYTNSRGKQYPCSAVINDKGLIVSFQNEEYRRGKKVLLHIREECTLSVDNDTLKVIHFEGWDGHTGRYPNPMVFERMTESKHPEVETMQSPANGLYTKQQLIEDSRELLEYIENIHPDPYLYGGGKVAFHRRFQNVLQSIPENGMTRDANIKLLNPFIAAICDAHTSIITPYEYDRSAPGGLPLSFGTVEKWIYVNGVIKEEHKFLIGAKLLSVQGIPIEQLKRRLAQIQAIENEYHSIFALKYFLPVKPYLHELIPEWNDFSRISAEFELPNGTKQSINFTLPVEKKSAYIKPSTKIQLPPTEKCDFGYSFLSPDKKTAVLKIDALTGYREMFESEMKSRDVSKEARSVYERYNDRKAPEEIDDVIAGIPSAITLFKTLFGEMKKAGTENLIVDLSKNLGGTDLMSALLTFFLYGKEAVTRIGMEETSVTKHSSYEFATLSERTLEAMNKQYSSIQSYPLTQDDYDFSYGRFVELIASSKMDTLTGLRLKYQDNPSFLKEIETREFDRYYTPKNVIAVSSNSTFSSGFTLLRYLYKSGAKIVGSTAAQSGNGFGNLMFVTLKHTKIKLTIAKVANNVFPEMKGEIQNEKTNAYYQFAIGYCNKLLCPAKRIS